MEILVPTGYLPPVHYLAQLHEADSVCIEIHEHFPKQTYRNRCLIQGANGIIPLIIPLEKSRNGKTPTKDIRISPTENWKRNHWRTLVSAYMNSPFFEYYRYELEPLFLRKDDWLIDWNLSLLEIICKWLNISTPIMLSETYSKTPTPSTIDFRSFDFYSTENSCFPAYTQVFSDRFPFLPNLSGIDLLFNTGPKAIDYLPSRKEI